MPQPVVDALQIEPLSGPCNVRAKVPGSKSYTNRALVLAALAEGTSVLDGALFSDDTLLLADALREIGIGIDADPARARFTVRGAAGRIPRREASVFVGNAGTAARFLTAMMTIGHGTFVIDGSAAMQKRPIGPLLDALAQLGAEAVSIRGTGCPPVRISARGLRGGATSMPGNVSSQYFTALLMCAPCTTDGITLTVEGDLVSKPYLDVTAQAMKAFGITLENDGYRRFGVAGAQQYAATTYFVEPDASAASYFFAAAAVSKGTATVHGLGSRSLQGDLGFVRILERMGCAVRQTETETEVVGPETLHGVEVDMRDLSDTAQTLAAIAPFADSPTRITGIGFIRRKETDRIGAVVRELRRIDVRAEEEADGLVVHPGQPQPGAIDTYDDHRMAMSFAVLGLFARGITIKNPGCVSKTFPDFFDAMAAIRR
jgi:3-phosphoshikimate 1-carboxyvinyltransferase